MSAHLTTLGFPAINEVPYGLHVCHFYPNRTELLDALIPYFQAGLRNNEHCIWVAADPLPTEDILYAIKQHDDLESGIASRQLEVINAVDWYGQSLNLNPEEIVRGWLKKEEEALARGRQGLRITRNTSFVPPEGWGRLMDYERMLHGAMQGRRIVACCSYRRATCEPVDIFEAVDKHDAALDLSENSWQVLTRPSLKLMSI